jgi:hypothetical protein
MYLSLFEKYLNENKKIYLDGNDIVFGDSIRVNKDTEIAEFSDRNNKKYTVGQVWYLLKNFGLKQSEYVKNSKSAGFQPIAVTDHK